MQHQVDQLCDEAEKAKSDEAALRRQVAATSAHVIELEATVERLQADLAAARSQSQQRTDDDLKQLRGIGPGFERALHAAGVTRFEQIAAWTPEDIAEIAAKLRTTQQRILRDDWIGAAKSICATRS